MYVRIYKPQRSCDPFVAYMYKDFLSRFCTDMLQLIKKFICFRHLKKKKKT